MPTRTWQCACGASAVEDTHPRRAGGGWRIIDGQDLCSRCAAARYRELGSTLRPGAGPMPLAPAPARLRGSG
jgi:hypothetical protein